MHGKYAPDTPPLDELPAIEGSVTALRQLFTSNDPALSMVLPNPHVEPQVAPEHHANARDASVLMLVSCATQAPQHPEPASTSRSPGPAPGSTAGSAAGPTLLFTERSAHISYAGHEVFPGGLTDPGDSCAEDTMWREVREEIGLMPADVELLGRLGDYYTHTGYRIAAFVGIASGTPQLSIDRNEVAGITHVPLGHLLDPRHYQLNERSRAPRRANFQVRWHGRTITGPTISLIISLYRALARTTTTQRQR